MVRAVLVGDLCALMQMHVSPGLKTLSNSAPDLLYGIQALRRLPLIESRNRSPP
jgi:hypothetical protein